MSGAFRSLVLLWVACMIALAGSLLAQRPTFPSTLDLVVEELELIHVKDAVWLLAGTGGNITVQVGADGRFLVDTGLESFSEPVIEQLSELSDGMVRMIVNTSTDLDHIGGNDAIASTGAPQYLAQNSGQVTIPVAQIVGHERAVLALVRQTGPNAVPQRLWPFDTFFGRLKTVFANDEPIEIHHLPAAHSPGDLMVCFCGSDVVSAGDVYDTTAYPRFDADGGGSLQGVLDALNRIIEIAIPGVNQMGGTRVIPGHGRISNESDVVEYRDMVTIVRDRIRALVEQVATLEQVREVGVTRDYDGIDGSMTGLWTTDMFIEAVYREERARAATQ